MVPPIIICGPPRTGSTLATRILSDSGLSLGKNDALNQFLVNVSMAGISDELTHRFPNSASLLRPPDSIPNGYENNPAICNIAADDNRGYANFRDMAIDYATTHFDTDKPWVIKHPQHGIFGRFWSSVFPGAKFIVLYRNPREAAESYQKMFNISSQASFTLWHYYIQRAIEQTDNDNRVFAGHKEIVYTPIATSLRVLKWVGGSPLSGEEWQTSITSYVDPLQVKSVAVKDTPSDLTIGLYEAISSGVTDTEKLQEFFNLDFENDLATVRAELDKKGIH